MMSCTSHELSIEHIEAPAEGAHHLIGFTPQVAPAFSVVAKCPAACSTQGHSIVDLIPERWRGTFHQWQGFILSFACVIELATSEIRTGCRLGSRGQ